MEEEEIDIFFEDPLRLPVPTGPPDIEIRDLTTSSTFPNNNQPFSQNVNNEFSSVRNNTDAGRFPAPVFGMDLESGRFNITENTPWNQNETNDYSPLCQRGNNGIPFPPNIEIPDTIQEQFDTTSSATFAGGVATTTERENRERLPGLKRPINLFKSRRPRDDQLHLPGLNQSTQMKIRQNTELLSENNVFSRFGNLARQPIQLSPTESQTSDNSSNMIIMNVSGRDLLTFFPFQGYLKGHDYKNGFPVGHPTLDRIPKGVILERRSSYENREITVKKNPLKLFGAPLERFPLALLEKSMEESGLKSKIVKDFSRWIGLTTHPSRQAAPSWSTFVERLCELSGNNEYPLNKIDVEPIDTYFKVTKVIKRQKDQKGKRDGVLDEYPYIIDLAREFDRNVKKGKMRKFMNCIEMILIFCTRILAVFKKIGRGDLIANFEPIVLSLYHGSKIPSSGIKKRI